MITPDGTLYYALKSCPMHGNSKYAGYVAWEDVKKAIDILEAEALAKHGKSEGDA
jgi:hypothetical protein